MKTIDTLVEDIYHLLRETTDHTDPGLLDINESFKRALSSREHGRKNPNLWASEYGDRCARRVWYKVHFPDHGEELEPHTRFKFLYGDVLEELALALAREAGHAVSHEQERVEVTHDNGTDIMVSGRLDAIIDETVVDVKSMSSYAFDKYKKAGGLTLENDSFGYIWQLALYHYVMQAKVPITSDPVILGIDKQNGHIALFPVLDMPTADQVREKLVSMYDAVFSSEEMPGRGYTDEAEGKSGNRKLGIACSYCAFKNECWPGLRTFIYSKGPVFLTAVHKEPNVPEVKLEETGSADEASADAV